MRFPSIRNATDRRGNEKEEARAEHEPPPPRAGSSPRHRPDV